ncbi:hypothetical protein CPU12_02355 [Malaciobacter molluscorum LMG 25693]|uniref:DUF1348 domain-containing protein n=1 Tax=Malaciobacter molluscorum LMG 25693 TaxID=870501 RepID=A0A2G1DKT7_9BACT|nr:nuclear transport factor 2 family protein [Malaciobacter molluscorum]AXX92689.1 DUF1348 domain-containing protein [Malaciobacter molluscorum LMG 25693]PHO19107.1 hypothetical protein CPU12_02355 [Malaciobacter molluscorum LMG 25693]
MKNQKKTLPPFSLEDAKLKARLAESAWNSKDSNKISLAYTKNCFWRNRDEFIKGREEIVEFLEKKFKNELEYKLIKELWSYDKNKIAVRFAYEWHDEKNQWYRSYGNENWEFDENGLMQKRLASINDIKINKEDRKLLWETDIRPDDYPCMSKLGL